MVRVSCCTRAGWIVPGTSAQKGACESHEPLRVSLLGSMEMGSVVPQLPNQGQDLMQNVQIQDGELRGSLLHTLIGFSCTGHRGRKVPKA